MAYLDIIKELEEELCNERTTSCDKAETPANHSAGEGTTDFEDISTSCEKSEISEKSPLVEHPPLGRKNDLGEAVMTIEDLPELEYRLRLSGWKVERRGYQLICRSATRPRIQ
jgi:hypothetical protein